MSNKELVINLVNSIPDSELLPIVDMLKTLYRLINNHTYVEEVVPDEFDIAMIEEAKNLNDGTTISFDELLKRDGLTYEDLQD